MQVQTIEPLITVKVAEELGLLPEEYEKIIEILGRNPNFTELSIFSVMWSEHCSYKNSIKWLKTLPRSGGRLLAEAGEENAGLVDIGDGLAVFPIRVGVNGNGLQHTVRRVACGLFGRRTVKRPTF